MSQIAEAAFWVGLALLPFAFVGGTFLHAAKRPQWVWMLSGRTQIVWIATLLIGNLVLPIGVPVAVYYLIRIRPELVAAEEGDMDRLLDTG